MDCSDTAGFAPVFVAAGVGLAIVGACVLLSCYSREVEDADEKGGAAKVRACWVLCGFGPRSLSNGLITGVVQGVAGVAQEEIQAQAQAQAQDSMDAGANMVDGTVNTVDGDMVGVGDMVGDMVDGSAGGGQSLMVRVNISYCAN
jgi:hypothetical protein